MKQNILLTVLAALVLCFNAWGQDKTAVKYGNTINKTDATKHLTIIASDEYEGRETGKPGAWKAAAYIAAHFKTIGLTPPVNNTYFQDVPLIEITAGKPVVKVNNKPFEFLKDFYYQASKTGFDKSVKEIVFVGYGIEDDKYNELKDVDLKGKVVLVIAQGEPMRDGKSVITGTEELSQWSTSNAKRLRNLQSKQPALILAYNTNFDTVINQYANYLRGGRTMLEGKSKEPAVAPVINISSRFADALLSRSKSTVSGLINTFNQSGKPASKPVKARFSANINPKITKLKAQNVLGYLEGSDLKDELLVITSHYDHIGLTTEGTDKVNNGADDDGSGTTGVLELAEAFAKAKAEGNGPRRSILFMTVTGEEKGLLGSDWYSQSPVFPLDKTIADLNIDMIGRVDPEHKDDSNYVYLIGSDKLSSDLHKISEYTNATYTRLNVDYKYNDPKDPNRFYYRSDHYNFAKHGIPIIFYFNGVHEDYHQPGDEVSKINFDMLVKRTQLVFYTGWDLVNRDVKPVVDIKNDFPADR